MPDLYLYLYPLPSSKPFKLNLRIKTHPTSCKRQLSVCHRTIAISCIIEGLINDHSPRETDRNYPRVLQDTIHFGATALLLPDEKYLVYQNRARISLTITRDDCWESDRRSQNSVTFALFLNSDFSFRARAQAAVDTKFVMGLNGR